MTIAGIIPEGAYNTGSHNIPVDALEDHIWSYVKAHVKDPHNWHHVYREMVDELLGYEITTITFVYKNTPIEIKALAKEKEWKI